MGNFRSWFSPIGQENHILTPESIAAVESIGEKKNRRVIRISDFGFRLIRSTSVFEKTILWLKLRPNCK